MRHRLAAHVPAASRFEYDEENRLVAVKRINGTPLLTMKYDALGRRIETADYVNNTGCDTGVPLRTRHIVAGLQTIEEYEVCGDTWYMCDYSCWPLAREYVWGATFTEPIALIDYTSAGDKAAGVEEVLHYVHDAQGSVVGLLDAGDPDATPAVSAKEVERYTYDPYGTTYIETWNSGTGTWAAPTSGRSKYGNPFMWTGQRYDPGVKLYHFPFRSYSPQLGRWLQRDPAGYVNGANLYQYVAGMPTGFTDPLGLAKDVWRPKGESAGKFGGDGEVEIHGGPDLPDVCGDPAHDPGELSKAIEVLQGVRGYLPPDISKLLAEVWELIQSGDSSWCAAYERLMGILRAYESARKITVGAYDPDDRQDGKKSWWGGDVATSADLQRAAETKDKAIPIHDVQELREALQKLREEGYAIVELTIFDHGAPGVQEIGDQYLNPYEPVWADVCRLVDGGPIVLAGCKVGAGTGLEQETASYTGQVTIVAYTGDTIYGTSFAPAVEYTGNEITTTPDSLGRRTGNRRGSAFPPP